MEQSKSLCCISSACVDIDYEPALSFLFFHAPFVNRYDRREGIPRMAGRIRRITGGVRILRPVMAFEDLSLSGKDLSRSEDDPVSPDDCHLLLPGLLPRICPAAGAPRNANIGRIVGTRSAKQSVGFILH